MFETINPSNTNLPNQTQIVVTPSTSEIPLTNDEITYGTVNVDKGRNDEAETRSMVSLEDPKYTRIPNELNDNIDNVTYELNNLETVVTHEMKNDEEAEKRSTLSFQDSKLYKNLDELSLKANNVTYETNNHFVEVKNEEDADKKSIISSVDPKYSQILDESMLKTDNLTYGSKNPDTVEEYDKMLTDEVKNSVYLDDPNYSQIPDQLSLKVDNVEYELRNSVSEFKADLKDQDQQENISNSSIEDQNNPGDIRPKMDSVINEFRVFNPVVIVDVKNEEVFDKKRNSLMGDSKPSQKSDELRPKMDNVITELRNSNNFKQSQNEILKEEPPSYNRTISQLSEANSQNYEDEPIYLSHSDIDTFKIFSDLRARFEQLSEKKVEIIAFCFTNLLTVIILKLTIYSKLGKRR